jgi:hypothetical protein
MKLPEDSIRVEDSIYSAKKLADIHPGGHLFIRVSIYFYNGKISSNIIHSEAHIMHAVHVILNSIIVASKYSENAKNMYL